MDCKVIGVISKIKNNKLTVVIEPKSACESCGGKTTCGSAKTKEISLTANGTYNIGDTVEIAMKSAALLKIVFTIYILGIIIAGVVSFGIAKLFNLSDTYGAILFLALTFLYLPLASFYLNKKSRIIYTLKPV